MASIYVGNLPYTMSENDLKDLFSKYGEVQAVKLIMDHQTGRPRGFAFVEMEKGNAREAIKVINGNEVGGRTLRVNEAHQRPPTSRPD